MALGTNHNTTTTAANYLPELWSDEVIAAYKSNTVMAPILTTMNHNGKKGDTIHIPNFTRGSANAKAASTQVVLNTATHGVTNISINKHYEYSYLIEDIVGVQGLDSIRQAYTDDAGYALSLQVDQDLHILGAVANGGTQYSTAVIGSDGSTVWDGTANTNTGNAAALSDAGIRRMIQTLDDADVPLMDRFLVIPPVEKKNLLGLARFTEQAFVGEVGGSNSIRNGYIGDVYGIPVYVSTNCVWVHTDTGDGDDYFDFSSATATTGTDATGTAVTIGAGGAAVGRVGLIGHKSWAALVEQQSVRTQTQYKQEYLADLFTADTIYGTGEVRDGGCVPFIVAN